ncbi:unnamed protein product [Ilex paraguariensis]|uniref:Uncharacterized protein n=1 Tax=Ilex paraguariensis TaxID=185542 RepID=A0ABC8RUK9_9AQUA
MVAQVLSFEAEDDTPQVLAMVTKILHIIITDTIPIQNHENKPVDKSSDEELKDLLDVIDEILGFGSLESFSGEEKEEEVKGFDNFREMRKSFQL